MAAFSTLIQVTPSFTAVFITIEKII